MFRKLTSTPLSCCTDGSSRVGLTGRARTGHPPRAVEARRRCYDGPVAYERGLHDLGDGCYAYLQPDGGWGWSNAGLVVGDGVSLLIDTLFDLRLTRAMLDSMAGVTGHAPIGTVVNTHANGDHCFGNQLVTGAEVVTSSATAAEMSHVPASLLDSLVKQPGEVGELFRGFFGAFDFSGIEVPPPDRTFDGRLELDVGGRSVELIEVGPAHTQGDVIAYVPEDQVVFTGDILFIGGTPIVWAGPLANWVAACDLMLGLAIETVVPGHGPITDKAGIAAVRDYLVFVEQEATKRHDAGMDAWEAARDIALGQFGTWGEFGRLAVNVDNVYRTLDPGHQSADLVEQFRRMTILEQREQA